MLHALDYVHCLLAISSHEDEPECLTHLQIQKHLYYLQGWSLALRGRPAFSEQIEAWRNGPVVREVWQHLHPFDAGPITKCCSNCENRLGDDELFFARVVWDAYKRFSAFGLRDKTHAEPPWKEAWGDLPPDSSGSNPISLESMRTFFSQQRDGNKGCHLVGIPDWEISPDEELAERIKDIFIKDANLLRRLAQ